MKNNVTFALELPVVRCPVCKRPMEELPKIMQMSKLLAADASQYFLTHLDRCGRNRAHGEAEKLHADGAGPVIRRTLRKSAYWKY